MEKRNKVPDLREQGFSFDRKTGKKQVIKEIFPYGDSSTKTIKCDNIIK